MLTEKTEVIKDTKLTEFLTLSECNNGFWLHDSRRCVNVAVMAETIEEAFIVAMEYYQKRLETAEAELHRVNEAVKTFINTVSEEDNFNCIG